MATVVQRSHASKFVDVADESDEARFGRQVKPMPNGCWAYRGELDRYHRFRTHTGAVMPAHRFAYHTLVGRRIPDGWHLHHECENKGCVNPEHLRPLSHADHMAHHGEAFMDPSTPVCGVSATPSR